MSLDVSIVKEPERLREEWQALAEKCADQDAYVQPFFLLQWGKQTKDLWSPEYVVVRRDNKLVGLLPLFRRSLKGCRILSFPVSGSTPPFDLIAEIGQEAEVAKAVAASVKARRDWDLLILHQLDLQHPPAAALSSALEDAGGYHIRDAGSTFVIGTHDGTYDEFMKALPSRFRREVKRFERRYLEMGEVKILTCPGDIALSDAMPSVRAVLENSWKYNDESSEATIRQLTQLAEAALAEDKLSLVIRFIDDKPCGYLLSFLHAKRLFPFSIAYDLALQKVGPGHVQINETVKRAFSDDTQDIDLGGGYSYLRNWATRSREYHEVRVVRSALRSRLMAAAYLKGKDERHAKARENVEKQKNDRKEEAKSKHGQQS